MTATCIYCGHQVEYGNHWGVTQQEAHQALIDHDQQCPKNPIAAERDAMAAQLLEIHRVTACGAEPPPASTEDWLTVRRVKGMAELINWLTETSLAQRDTQVAADAVQGLIDKVRNRGGRMCIGEVLREADELRRQADGGDS